MFGALWFAAVWEALWEAVCSCMFCNTWIGLRLVCLYAGCRSSFWPPHWQKKYSYFQWSISPSPFLSCRHAFWSALVGSYIYLPSNPYFIQILSTLPTLGRREKGLERYGDLWTTSCWLGVFSSLGPIFIVRISPTAKQSSSPAIQ